MSASSSLERKLQSREGTPRHNNIELDNMMSIDYELDVNKVKSMKTPLAFNALKNVR